MPQRNLITDIAGVRVGNADDARLASGVTAIIFDEPAVAAVDVRGGAATTAHDVVVVVRDPAFETRRMAGRLDPPDQSRVDERGEHVVDGLGGDRAEVGEYGRTASVVFSSTARCWPSHSCVILRPFVRLRSALPSVAVDELIRIQDDQAERLERPSFRVAAQRFLTGDLSLDLLLLFHEKLK